MIKNTKDINNHYLKILVYGHSGVGKTYLSSTIPKNNKGLILSFEEGLLSVNKYDISYIDMVRGAESSPLKDQDKFKHWLEVYKLISTPALLKEYQWLFIDSITELSHQIHKILYPKYELEKSIDQRLYNEFFIKMRSFIKSFLELPLNVIFTALPAEDTEGNIRIDSYGKIKTMLPAYFDEVFYLIKKDTADEEESKRLLLTETTRNIIAKDRSGKLNKFEEANITTIYNKITSKDNNEKKEPRETTKKKKDRP